MKHIMEETQIIAMDEPEGFLNYNYKKLGLKKSLLSSNEEEELEKLGLDSDILIFKTDIKVLINSNEEYTFTKEICPFGDFFDVRDLIELSKNHNSSLLYIEEFIETLRMEDIIIRLYYLKKLIGYALISRMDFDPLKELDKPFCLEYLFITEKYRSKGLGVYFMNHIMKKIQIIFANNSDGFFHYNYVTGNKCAIYCIFMTVHNSYFISGVQ